MWPIPVPIMALEMKYWTGEYAEDYLAGWRALHPGKAVALPAFSGRSILDRGPIEHQPFPERFVRPHNSEFGI